MLFESFIALDALVQSFQHWYVVRNLIFACLPVQLESFLVRDLFRFYRYLCVNLHAFSVRVRSNLLFLIHDEAQVVLVKLDVVAYL